MAITTITITQDNIVSGSDLLPVHSPLVFLADVDHDGTAPDYINCDVYDQLSGNLLTTLRCIPYSDLTVLKRQFMLLADEWLRMNMETFDDFVQTGSSLQYCQGFTKTFTLTFYDPSVPTTNDSVTFTAIHGCSQFGSYPNLVNIFNNVTEEYVAAKNKPVYVYFYNSDTSRTLSVTVT